MGYRSSVLQIENSSVLQIKMNILILNWRDPKNPKSGGAEIVTMGHAKAWIMAGHRVTWFTSKFKNCKAQEEIEGINIIRKGNSLTVYLLAPIFYFVTGQKFDIVVDEIHGLPFFTPIYVHKPKIAFIHEVADEIWDSMYPFPISVLGKLFESIYFRFYQNIKFWTDADSTIGDLEKQGIKRKNCTVINCPIVSKPLIKLPEKEKNTTFIFVSRIVKMKGIEEVIKAFHYVSIENMNARLWIVGNGDKKYENELREMINIYSLSNKVKFWGRVSEENKFKLLGKAHLLLHASVKEGWGLVVIEAASQGTPSVVYNVSGLKDSVKNNKTGIVLERNVPEEMAKEALKLFEEKERYRTYQINGLAWSKSLTWEKAAKESLNLINNTYENK
jgi:glycosyltransferase involved in cell wall biosynthesis